MTELEAQLRFYLDLSSQSILSQLQEILVRSPATMQGKRVPYNAVETLLCYGLFYCVNPHRYGGANIHRVPTPVLQVATFCHRTTSSIINKMLNLDGSRAHGAKREPLLYVYFAEFPHTYLELYVEMMHLARQMNIGPEQLPDFLEYLTASGQGDVLLGQEELPQQTSELLHVAGLEQELPLIEQSLRISESQTEKFAERKVRLTQHLFARQVLENCAYTCVFCGFAPYSLLNSGLLHASHIKPWREATPRERMDVQNGLAACPTHDAAFDRGLLTVNGGYRIHQAQKLRQSMVRDRGVDAFFGSMLRETLLLPVHAKMPAVEYLEYHRLNIFNG